MQSRPFKAQQPNSSIPLFRMDSTLMLAEGMGTGTLCSDFPLINMS